MAEFDPRLTPARPDLAATFLRGQIKAARYVEGELVEVLDPIVPLRRAPSHDAPLDTEALKGERVTIYERTAEGWAWAQLQRDGYVGWMPDIALVKPRSTPNHVVTALRTFAFPGPSIKLPPAEILPMGARVEIVREDDTFAITYQRHFIPRSHVAPLGDAAADFVAIAERFVGTPYLWGGKSSLGTDCSGLVQASLAACGIECLRDSDMQQGSLGVDVPLSQIGALRRGDLVFWKGHVAIARDAATLVHANAFHMATAVEPMRDAVARIASAGSNVVAIRRLIKTSS